MRLPRIMIGMMVKNSAKYLPKILDEILELDYPKSKLRLVCIYGDSADNTLGILRDFKKKSNIKTEVFKERRDNWLKILKQYGAGTIWNDLQEAIKDDEEYFLLIDSDLVKLPTNLIKELLKVDADIVAPYPWVDKYIHFFDTWAFRINNQLFDPFNPPGKGLKYPIETHNVGTCFLANREVWTKSKITNPHPYLTFYRDARKKGYKIAACPYLEVFHADLEAEGIFHFPPPKQYGGYPSGKYINKDFPVKRVGFKKEYMEK